MAVFLYPPISVSTSTGPSTFIQDGAQQVVTEDTVTPANNAPLPSKIFIQKDGQPLPVTKDTGTPSNNVAVPVELVGAAGPINITAGDLNVQLTDQGPNADVTRIGDGTNQLSINSDGSLSTKSVGTLSTNNSTVANLGIGATFTGLGDDCLNFGSISIAIYADQDSATLGLKFQASEDNVTWYDSDTYNYKATSGMQTYSLAPVARYFRLVYVNGGTATTTLKIQVIFRQFYVKPSSHRIGDTITQENDAELTKSVLTAQKPNGDFTPIDATAAGNLKTSVEEFDNNALNWGAGAANTRTQRVILASDQVMNLPTGAATETTLATLATEATALNTYNEIVTLGNEANTNALTQIQQLGAINETAPATDTADSGLNGRLQRIAQRLTSLIALFPSSIGQKAKANSLSVTLATDQGALSVTPTNKSGTITNAQVTVGTSAVRATVSGSAPNAARKKLIIKSSKNNTGSIYLGSSSVTTANGLEIIGPDRLEFELDASDYYLISDTAAQVVEVLEVV